VAAAVRFQVEVTFPGDEWARVRDVVEFFDNAEPERGESARTALSQIESFVRATEKRYARYGAKVSW